ncbi:FAD/NAD(P)-binding domain-containing protein [Xylariaceae sp. FL0594]|nr:FAD/NAD(P)-binding domain-containing protein [Xylariaceae sp. FL0594]
MPLNILVVGAGVGGPAFAAMMRRADPTHRITVIERAERLRQSGLQIDIRSQGIPILRKMGLLDTVHKHSVPEEGMSFVDTRGRAYATFRKNDSGKGAQGFTSEYEIMRGDLVDIFYKDSLGLDQAYGEKEGEELLKKDGVVTSADGNVRYEFGVTVASLSQHDADGVDVVFSDGREARFDLVVGADGQWSRTRRMMLRHHVSNKDKDEDKKVRYATATDPSFKSLGLFMGYYQLPRSDADDVWMKWHLMTGKRAMITRSADAEAPLQVYMSILPHSKNHPHFTTKEQEENDRYGLRSAMRHSVEAQKQAFMAAFADQHGWRVDELVRGLRDKVSDDEFYATEIGQVRIEGSKWAVGRVVLLGDAGYCPAPVTGMGTTMSLTGAYVLAGELSKISDNNSLDNKSNDNVPEALQAYSRALKPFVDEGQTLAPGIPGHLYAETSWGVWILATFIALVSKLRIVDLLMRLLPETQGGLKLPEYPDLKLNA